MSLVCEHLQRREAGKANRGESWGQCFKGWHMSKRGADVFYFLGEVSCKVISSGGGRQGRGRRGEERRVLGKLMGKIKVDQD